MWTEWPQNVSALVAAGRANDGAEDLTGQLAAFEHGTFQLEQELQGLDERGIDELRGKLAAAKQECSEKIKKLLHQHYPAFISASKVSRTPLQHTHLLECKKLSEAVQLPSCVARWSPACSLVRPLHVTAAVSHM